MNDVIESNRIAPLIMREGMEHHLAVDVKAGPGKLAEALAKARAKCKAAHKDSQNTFHKYKYASAESIIDEAKAALEESGLALVPLTQEMSVVGQGNTCVYELRRLLTLVHSSGENLPVSIRWPVIPDRGRPLDKAFASAITTSLSYYLRDLLMMPRVDPDDDMSGREDRDEPESPRPQKQAPPAKAEKPAALPPAKQNGNEMPKTGEELEVRLCSFSDNLAKQGLCRNGELMAYIQKHAFASQFPPDMKTWNQAQIKVGVSWARNFEAECRNPPKPDEQTEYEEDIYEGDEQ